MSSRKWATVLRAAGRGPLGSRSSLDGDSMTTAEPWWARVQQPHVARRTNRANTVRQLRTIVLPSYQTWCTARRAAQRFGAPLASPIARKQGVGSIQMASRSRWRSRRPAVWPPRLEQATIVETAKAAPQDDPSTRAGQGSRKTIRRVLWRWEQPHSHRSPRMHTIWSSGRNRESYQRPLVQLPRTARYPLLWDIHSMVRPRVQRHADEKLSILGEAAAFGCANWWRAHSIGRRAAFVWTAPAPAQR